MKKRNKGITLIALVITIVILLILAGLSISALTGSGLFAKAEDAAKISKLKEIEEFARIAYMTRQIDEITEGKATTIAGVVNDLKEKGYTIKEVTGGANTIVGIKVNEEKIEIERNKEKEITYTFIYSDETTVRYFTEVEGRDYEIVFNNGEITVNTEETNIEEINKKPEVTVTSSDSTIIEANKTEDGKIKLTTKDKIGDVEITVKEINSNVTKTFIAKIIVPATSLTVTPTEVTIMRGDTTKLTATVEPTNTTDKVTWSSSDEKIATVAEDGTVTGIAIGTTKITVKCGKFFQECLVEVIPRKISLIDLIDGGVSLNEIGVSRTILNGNYISSDTWWEKYDCQMEHSWRRFSMGSYITPAEVRFVFDLSKLNKKFGLIEKISGSYECEFHTGTWYKAGYVLTSNQPDADSYEDKDGYVKLYEGTVTKGGNNMYWFQKNFSINIQDGYNDGFLVLEFLSYIDSFVMRCCLNKLYIE